MKSHEKDKDHEARVTDETGCVKSIVSLDESYRVLELKLPGIAATAKPGQFVHLRVPGLEKSALRRPFSIYGANRNVVKILFKIVGRGSLALSKVKPGDEITVMGPLGNAFPVCDKEALPVCVAGGFGVAPLSFYARTLRRKGVLLIGGRSKADILCIDDFKKLGWEVRVATQDGSSGTKGLVTVLQDEILQSGKKAEFFGCGPTGMLKAVGERAAAKGLKAWLSLDEFMVCGVGACLGCVRKFRRDDGSEYIGRVCKDGPIFEMREIIW